MMKGGEGDGEEPEEIHKHQLCGLRRSEGSQTLRWETQASVILQGFMGQQASSPRLHRQPILDHNIPYIGHDQRLSQNAL